MDISNSSPYPEFTITIHVPLPGIARMEMNMNATSRRPSFPILLLASLLLLPCGVIAQGISPSSPAALGESVVSVVEIGVVAASNYDVTITVLETLRGAAALDKLKAANPAIASAKEGFEYLLARVRFELRPRAVSDKGVFDLAGSPFQWVANAADLRAYESIAVTPPEPALQGPVKAGETKEGWAAFAVERQETKPVLTFDPAAGGATGRGNILFFKLY
jgi:hypothetical protein